LAGRLRKLRELQLGGRRFAPKGGPLGRKPRSAGPKCGLQAQKTRKIAPPHGSSSHSSIVTARQARIAGRVQQPRTATSGGTRSTGVPSDRSTGAWRAFDPTPSTPPVIHDGTRVLDRRTGRTVRRRGTRSRATRPGHASVLAGLAAASGGHPGHRAHPPGKQRDQVVAGLRAGTRRAPVRRRRAGHPTPAAGSVTSSAPRSVVSPR